MKTRIIHTKIHEDSYFRSLSDREQNFFFFLITNEKVNLIGIYKCPDWYILACKPTWNSLVLQQMKDKFSKDGKFLFINDWVKIVNYDKYNQYTGDLNKKAIQRETLEVPEEVLEYSIDTVSIGYLEFSKTHNTPSNKKSVISNKKSVISNQYSEVTKNDVFEKDQRLKDIQAHFNQTFHKKYRITEAWAKNALKWLSTYSSDEVIEAITKWHDNGWWADPDIVLLFRTSNKHGACDYIGELLNSEKKGFVI